MVFVFTHLLSLLPRIECQDADHVGRLSKYARSAQLAKPLAAALILASFSNAVLASGGQHPPKSVSIV